MPAPANKLGRPRTDPIKRFWSKVIKTKFCWEYQGSKNRGYGAFHIGPIMIYAHRYSYELHNGPIKEGLLVLHKCDNPCCVNPKHLFLGTQKENLDDMRKKGRQNYASGEHNGMFGRKGALNPMYGKTRKHSEESRRKMSASQTGRRHSEETKKKISESLRRNQND